MLAAFSLGVGTPTVSKAHAKSNFAHLLSCAFFTLHHSRRRQAWLSAF